MQQRLMNTKLQDIEKFGRGGGGRKYEPLNKACALYALQPPLRTNWNKWNKPLNEPEVESLGKLAI
jgi:hypothetical protein